MVRIGKAYRYQICIGFLALLILVARRPDIFYNPQFFAEDGRVFFQAAYNSGFAINTLFEPYSGYIHIVPRLTALVTGFFDATIAPLVFNIVALSIQILPIVILWSNRFEKTIPNKWYKAALTFIYLCIPFSAEIHGNLTNSQWYLVLVGFLLIYITESKSRLINFIDRILLSLVSLTGPFSIFLTPIALIEAVKRKSRSGYIKFGIVFGASLLQVILLLTEKRLKEDVRIGESITKLLDIIGGQIYVSGLFGHEAQEAILAKTWIGPIVAVIGIQVMIICLIKSPRILRSFVALGTMIFLSALVTPLNIGPTASWWESLNNVGGYARYYFILHVGIFASLLYIVFNYKKFHILLSVFVGVVLLGSLFIGIVSDFKHEPYQDLNYSVQIREFEASNEQITTIEINPVPWEMELRK